MKLLRALPALFALLPACYAPGPEEVDRGSVGSAVAHLGTDACGGCPAGQLCGPGCATDGSVGCFTPGGTEKNPGKWDCASCFPHPEMDATCAGVMGGDIDTQFPVPHAWLCQAKGDVMGGCAAVGSVNCCD